MEIFEIFKIELFQKDWNFSKEFGIDMFLLVLCDSKYFGSSNFFGFHKGIEKMMMIMMMMINEVNTMTTRQNDLGVKNLWQCVKNNKK